jgi:hypothetical protein
MLRNGFYIKLPQLMVALTNGNNVAYNLTTWQEADDLTGLTAAQVRTQMLDLCLQDRPIAPCPANLNLSNANIDSATICKQIHAKILKLGFGQICALIFVQLCPGYSNQPHAVLELIRQTSNGLMVSP